MIDFKPYFKKLKQLPLNKKLYISLWLGATVILITLIALLIAFANNPNLEQKNTLAALAALFVLSLTVAVFATVFASMQRKKKLRLKKTKQGGK